MKYNFDEIVDRRNTCAEKWEITENELPMWVADMDLRTAPEITAAIIKRAEHGVFGYSYVPDEWYNAYIYRWKNCHDFEIERKWLIFCTGVIPAISSVVRKLTTPAEKVLIQTPVYNIFFNCILNNGRQVIENPLKYDGESYSIDFEDLELKLSDPQTTLMLLCNPHNPVGKIWDRETLERIGELCKKHNVIVLSDEIHCDLTDPGRGYIPFASVSDTCRDNSVTCISPTKAFNLAGMHSSAVVVPNIRLRNRVNRALNTDEIAEPNAFAVTAAIAAFTEGEEWLEELREYIFENKKVVSEFIGNEIPQIKLVPSEATYLLWLDCTALGHDDPAEIVREKTGLFLSAGSIYGACGKGFMRMNIACPRDMLTDGLERLKRGIEILAKEI